MARRSVTFLALATVLLLAPAATAAAQDAQAPTGAVGGVRSQATGVLTLSVLGVDDGLGLSRATAALDGNTLDESPFGDGTCVEVPDAQAGRGCPAVSTATLEVPTTAVPDGPHELTVTVRDAALNVATIVRQTVTVVNTPPKNTSTVTVTVGSGRVRTPAPSDPGGPVDPGETEGCAAPRLDVFLASAPLRIRKGKPVLVAGRKYNWRGRLTCRVDGKRRSAPRGTFVQLRSVVRGRVVATRKLRVGRRGRLSVRLAFGSSRVLVFRFVGANDRVVRVRVPIRVIRRPKARAVAAAAGGLSITPAILEQTARSGATGTVTIANGSNRKLSVAVKPRPWRQSRSGTVASDRRRTLGRFVRLSDASFTLAPDEKRVVTVTLTRVPSRRSLYGNLEVIGKARKSGGPGIDIAYRLIGSLRFNPAASARRIRLSAGAARVSRDSLALQVRNAGNTIDPVGGSVVVRGPRGGRSRGIAGLRILPGKRVNLPLMSLNGLRAGRYTAAVTLRQRGRNRVSVTRRFRIR